MNVIYILTILIIYILLMLMHKTEKRQNLIKCLAISWVLILCYNIFICLINTFAGVLCTLQNLSICNVFMIGILTAIILKQKKVQKYNLKIADLIYSTLLLILVIFIGYKQYGFPFNIKYEITDASTHYFFAEQFYEKSTLLYNEPTNDFLRIYNSDFRLPGAYINEGILFKVFDKTALHIDIFIIFDLFILYLSGILFYYLLRAHKNTYSLASIFSIIYVLAYQLNSMLCGFVYLSLALGIIITFLLVIKEKENLEMSNSISLPILSLLSIGIAFSYAFFIPIIYGAIIIEIIIKAKTQKEKIISVENIVTFAYLVVIPGILAIFYFILLPFVNGIENEISTIGTEGNIYENFITNYIAFLPILVIGTISAIKNKKRCNLPVILLVLSALFAIVLFIGYKLEVVSRYYFFKAYYIIWMFVILNTYMAVGNTISQNKAAKIAAYIYISIYTVAVIISTLLPQNIGINNIFYDNIKFIKCKEIIIARPEMQVLKKKQKLDNNESTYVLGSTYQGRMQWLSVLYNNQYIYIDYLTDSEADIQKWLNDKKERYYLAYYEDYKVLNFNQEAISEDNSSYKIIYNDEYAFILERK